MTRGGHCKFNLLVTGITQDIWRFFSSVYSWCSQKPHAAHQAFFTLRLQYKKIKKKMQIKKLTGCFRKKKCLQCHKARKSPQKLYISGQKIKLIKRFSAAVLIGWLGEHVKMVSPLLIRAIYLFLFQSWVNYFSGLLDLTGAPIHGTTLRRICHV